ncbi:substrate-binding domain-containing protein [Actinoplanes sp. TBRC 11911]|nr:substrate-binding domain-containing protein [Actinoplanes sp. TBRC 11911]
MPGAALSAAGGASTAAGVLGREGAAAGAASTAAGVLGRERAAAGAASTTAGVPGREGAAAGVSGVAVTSAYQDVAGSGRVGLDVLARAGVPDLSRGSAFRVRAGRSLDMPQQLIGRRQAEHLAAAGHTRIGYAAPDDARLRIFAEPRLAGVRAVCHAEGLAAPAIETVALDAAQAADAVRRWRAQGVTAICAYNDEVALAVLAGIRVAGVANPASAGACQESTQAGLVGGVLAVIGVDDIPAARLATPALTTVTTDQIALAAHLAASVVAAVSGQPAPALPVADLVRVIVRESA